MTRPLPFAAALLAGLLLACGPVPGPVSAPPSSPPGVPQSLRAVPLRLPDGAVVSAELALTPEQRRVGLMYRDALAADRGMLFVFPGEDYLVFWMKDTYIDLDMVFVGADRRVTAVHAGVPHSYPGALEDLLARRAGRGRFVLELAAGAAKRHGLKAGDRLEFEVPVVAR